MTNTGPHHGAPTRAFRPSRRAVLGGAAALGLGALAGPARAQGAYPSRPIRFIVAVGSGGATDTAARRVAERLSAVLGRPIVVENMPQASGVTAAHTVANAEPDGHTILIGTNTTHAGNQSLLRSMNYDPVNDFAPISRLGLAALILGVNPQLPFRTVSELVAHAKANPGQLSFGNGTASGRFAIELFMAISGIELLNVPYRGNANALNDLLGGQISMLFGDTTLMLPQVRAGTVRGLAVSSAQRSRLAPDLPTMQEAGVPGYELVGWIAAFAPARTPQPIVQRLNEEIRKILADEAFAARLADVGIEAAPTSPDELRAFVVSETAKWAEIARRANIERQ